MKISPAWKFREDRKIKMPRKMVFDIDGEIKMPRKFFGNREIKKQNKRKNNMTRILSSN